MDRVGPDSPTGHEPRASVGTRHLGLAHENVKRHTPGQCGPRRVGHIAHPTTRPFPAVRKPGIRRKRELEHIRPERTDPRRRFEHRALPIININKVIGNRFDKGRKPNLGALVHDATDQVLLAARRLAPIGTIENEQLGRRRPDGLRPLRTPSVEQRIQLPVGCTEISLGLQGAEGADVDRKTSGHQHLIDREFRIEHHGGGAASEGVNDVELELHEFVGGDLFWMLRIEFDTKRVTMVNRQNGEASSVVEQRRECGVQPVTFGSTQPFASQSFSIQV